MASSLIANAIQINFDSVLGISDNDGMVNMFKALEASGLQGFLGCPSTLAMDEDTQLSLPPPVDQPPLPTASITVISESLSKLRASVSRLIANQTKDSRRMGDSQSEVISTINHLEKALLDALSQQNLAFRSLIQSVRQEAHNQTDVLSIGLKAVRAQNAILSTDLADVRKEVKTQKAELFQEMDERLATIRSGLLDFHAQAQENNLNLSTQLGFLVDYINRGGDAKKGEGGSSRPQPPLDDQNRPSGGSGSRGGDSKRRRGSGGSRERHSSGGSGGGPIKRDAEYWIYGKRQF
ncbi:structural maintenance of chromosomes protein 3 [Dorcoceras hygrometricum]|uniref:Structural maintenance of chromosomes protein 3 n=1 Tax=Dorcoceras hygrometricum TaxID=472368 RepID=A0A2Z7BQN0_9LAMI|nr:structural maintenance of chromosomes protein 3 [Dorcoceras hygrometricum]